MSDVPADLDARVEGMAPKKGERLEGLLEPEIDEVWLPNGGPQMQA